MAGPWPHSRQLGVLLTLVGPEPRLRSANVGDGCRPALWPGGRCSPRLTGPAKGRPRGSSPVAGPTGWRPAEGARGHGRGAPRVLVRLRFLRLRAGAGLGPRAPGAQPRAAVRAGRGHRHLRCERRLELHRIREPCGPGAAVGLRGRRGGRLSGRVGLGVAARGAARRAGSRGRSRAAGLGARLGAARGAPLGPDGGAGGRAGRRSGRWNPGRAAAPAALRSRLREPAAAPLPASGPGAAGASAGAGRRARAAAGRGGPGVLLGRGQARAAGPRDPGGGAGAPAAGGAAGPAHGRGGRGRLALPVCERDGGHLHLGLERVGPAGPARQGAGGGRRDSRGGRDRGALHLGLGASQAADQDCGRDPGAQAGLGAAAAPADQGQMLSPGSRCRCWFGVWNPPALVSLGPQRTRTPASLSEVSLRRSPRIKQLALGRTKSGPFYSASHPQPRSVQRVHSSQQSRSGNVPAPRPRWLGGEYFWEKQGET
ncbi:RCC1 domain-containing protein 1 isoform X1 [Myotis daubentonii]|uniref:RCC1 domain-containing protein 1 isoform X1 n=1 Tax=Myotis daubentonii TaxID=98922 RepID=UPI002873BEFB|nr:RCC1 domain-containing protein 1 isoform X1 [Myotis daubentonii]